MAKTVEGRHVGVAAGRAPVADGQRALEGPTGRDDLAVDRAERRVRQGAGVEGGQPIEDLSLARRGKRLSRLRGLGTPDLMGMAPPLADQLDDALVQIVNRFPVIVDVHVFKSSVVRRQ